MLALLSPALAQEAQEREPPLWQVVEDEVELQALLDLFSDAFAIGIDYDRTKVQGSVTIRSGPGVTEESLWATTNRLLAEKGLACVRAPGEDTLSVVPLEKAAALARIEEGDPALARAGTIRVLRTLRSEEPDAVVEALKAALPKEGGVALQLAASANVLLAGQKPQVLQALTLLDLLDAGPRETIVEEIPAKNVPALTLATLIDQVSQKRKGIDRKALRGRWSRTRARGPS